MTRLRVERELRVSLALDYFLEGAGAAFAPEGLGVFGVLAAAEALAEGVAAGAEAVVVADAVVLGDGDAPVLELVMVVTAATVGAVAWGATAPESLAGALLVVASLESEQPQTSERLIIAAPSVKRR